MQHEGRTVQKRSISSTMAMVAAGSSEILASNRLYGITVQKTTVLTVSALKSKFIYESLEKNMF